MNEHVIDQLALYALDGLEPDEHRMVDAHLAFCAACQAEAEREARLVAVLAESIPTAGPDPRLRAKTLARLGIRSAQPSRPARPTAKNPDTPRGWLTLPRWVPVALSLVLAVLAGWNVYLTSEVNTLRQQVVGATRAVGLITAATTKAIALAAADGDPAAGHGNAYVNVESHAVVLVVQQLAPLAANEIYQAWLMTDAGPVSAGLFSVTATGWGMTWLSVPFETGAVIGVSREPAGGSVEPTVVVLVGGL